MIQNELRDNKGKYIHKKLNKEIAKSISNLYKKHKNKVSWDSLHLLICDASFNERVIKIVMES